MIPTIDRAPIHRSSFRRHSRVQRLTLLLTLLLALFLISCGNGASEEATGVAGGEPERGRAAMQEYGCNACHTIPGVPEADAEVGPPLTGWANRQYIAGTLTNTPANLIFWLMNPQEVEPGTAMPDMGVTEPDARDMAAYLYQLD
jgi:cytochrome c2